MKEIPLSTIDEIQRIQGSDLIQIAKVSEGDNTIIITYLDTDEIHEQSMHTKVCFFHVIGSNWEMLKIGTLNESFEELATFLKDEYGGA